MGKDIKKATKEKQFVLVPDDLTSGLYCRGQWIAINQQGQIGTGRGYVMSPETKRNLIKHTRLAIKDTQKSLRELTTGLCRLRTAPTKIW